MKWYRLSAEQGFAESQYRLGVICAHGQRGLRRDPKEAMKWYRFAAEQGHALAQTALAGLYGAAKNWSEAAKWYRLSADQGNTIAQWRLGGLYAKGLGVKEDPVQAYTWIGISGQGAATLKALAQKLTPEQIEEAQRLASEWKPKKTAHPLT